MQPDALIRVAGQLYRSAVSLHPSQFRAWALRSLDRIAPFDAALWATGHVGDRCDISWDDAMVMALPREFLAGLARAGVGDPLVALWRQGKGQELRSGTFSVEHLPPAGGIRSLYERYGIQSGSYVHYTNPISRVSNIIATFTFHKDQHRAEQISLLESVITGLVDAASFCFFMHLSRPVGLDRRKSAAICDASDLLIESQAGFLTLLKEAYPKWTGPKLPFSVKDLGAASAELPAGLLVETETLESLRIVRLWQRTELDTLTRRELEFVSKALLGLTDKEIANDSGLATSTVSNRLAGAFRKLGVSSRRNLRRKYAAVASNPP